ncbi:hypothetical protein Moror_16142 [Moniliophthora roreri MCA 2997]|uniref:Isomerase YbhE n=2 Tax=Moniliophthora roreri TaxID=221103 RepID=V2WRG4_MONRO|nr:hypothetical protein Moror_16142 [Moniliophthora roreri MCA 2997]KAI3608174.1 hypothetical protein WG66_006596 [Moniliophthora roreri]
MTFKILVASYTNDIATLEFDPDTSSISLVATTQVGHHPSWVTSHPKDPTLVFACIEQTEGRILALKYDENGKGTIVASAPSGGSDPCHLLVHEEELLIANYSSGDMSVLPISHKAPYILSQHPDTTEFTGSGPNTKRQLSSHAHGVHWSKEMEEVLVPDLGGDHVYRFRKQSGKWEIVGKISFEAGGGPRHCEICDGILYTVLELSSSLTTHKLNPEFPFLANVPTRPEASLTADNMLAAEILIPPPNTTYPVPYIYVSNRNDPSPEGDTIAIFTPDVQLGPITQIRTGLSHVRGIIFFGPQDKWLIAGGGNSGGVKVFERVDEGRGLKEVAALGDVNSATGFLYLQDVIR